MASVDRLFEYFCTPQLQAILDLGCGAGAHVELLLSRDFDAFGSASFFLSGLIGLRVDAREVESAGSEEEDSLHDIETGIVVGFAFWRLKQSTDGFETLQK